MMRFFGGLMAALAGLVGGAVAGRSWWTARARPDPDGPVHAIEGVGPVRVVSDRLWRGPQPEPVGYRALRDRGVGLIVDLRAEADAAVLDGIARAAGLDFVAIPMRDAGPPAPGQFERFAAAHRSAAGITYVHCRAGEGRTGAMVGALRVAAGEPRSRVLGDALAIGGVTFGQLSFAATGGKGAAMAQLVDRVVDRPTEALRKAVQARL